MAQERQMTHQEQKELLAGQEQQIKDAMARIKNRVVVFSGKGGVGKTTLSVNLAYALAKRGTSIGLLDADITGPNVPQMVGLSTKTETEQGTIVPHEKAGVRIISLASIIPLGTPVIWRGPLRSKAIDQLLGETRWGELDFLIIDLPPGTGTSPQMAIVVTTPQEVSLIDARRATNMAKKMGLSEIGIVENMSGLVCPHCGGDIDLFGRKGGERLAEELAVRFLGRIPIDVAVRVGGDTGEPIVLAAPEAIVSLGFCSIAERICNVLS
jgi:ATP-binding protein involved in chromosome partitioning